MEAKGEAKSRPKRHDRPYVSGGSTSSLAELEAILYEDDLGSGNGNEISETGVLRRPGQQNRRRDPQQYKNNQNDFYVRIAEAYQAWSKTRRKSIRSFGRFLLVILAEAWRARWIVKLQIIFLIAIFTTSLVFTIHIYHHSHWKPYPWRLHCAQQPVFPMQKYRSTEPAGILLGVMSMASENAAKRRMQIRESWADHWASRGRWEEGKIWSQQELLQASSKGPPPPAIMNSTSRVVVRFIMGKPEGDWEDKITKENEQYNDIVILPMKENMNDGKTFAFFDWAFKHALVPPTLHQDDTSTPTAIYDGERDNISKVKPRHQDGDDDQPRPHGWANAVGKRPPAPHDPLATTGKMFPDTSQWVRPDFIVKADDDSFILLAELEARLRVLPRNGVYWGYPNRASGVDFHAGEAYALSWDLVGHISTFARQHQSRSHPHDGSPPEAEQPSERAVIDRFQNLDLNIIGREDQVTALWMKHHGKEWGVTWYGEQCWIYDHPKAGTVFSKGFLFPLEVKKIVQEWTKSSFRTNTNAENETPKEQSSAAEYDSARPEYKRLHDPTYSTVLRAFYRSSYPFAVKWETRYRSPLSSFLSSKPTNEELPMKEALEMDGLVEGSLVSMVMPADGEEGLAKRWKQDADVGWKGRYLLNNANEIHQLPVPIGGTVVVHYVKAKQHWSECEEVLLNGWGREQRAKIPFIDIY